MGFRLVPKSVTLNDLERRNGRVVCVISPNSVALGLAREWDGGNPAKSAGFPRVWVCYGNTAGMDLTIAGFPRGWILLGRELRKNGPQILL